MNTTTIKSVIRLYMRDLRNSLQFSEQYVAAQLITNKIISLKNIQKSEKIAIFISIDGEIRTDLLIKSLLFMNKHIYLPIIPTLKCKHLLFAQYTLSTPLVRNDYFYNIYEPKYNEHSILSADKIDVIFVPLVAFDDHGNRLGMGGGFYDKTLQYWNNKINRVCIGLGYDFQKIPNCLLPMEKQDVKLSKIITPSYFF